jgi:branched-chain amino acid aminotransferase
MTIWLDGELVDTAEARVSVLDHGMTVGDGVFETMRTVTTGDGALAAFALSRHLRRLRRSLTGLGLELPTGDDDLRVAVARVLEANGPGTGRVRITVTGGVAPLGSDRAAVLPTVVVATGPGTVWPATATVVTVPWRRNEHSAVAGLKTTSYAENVVALDHAHRHGAGEAVFANTAGHLCEGTGTNVFVVHDGVLRTPPLSSGCLAGITRELVLELVDVVEEDTPLESLASADEAFLTSSTRDIQPIAIVDGQPLPVAPGPRTQAAMDAFTQLAASTDDP